MFKRMKHSTKILPTLVAAGTMLTSPVMAQGDVQRGFLESRAKEIKSAQKAPSLISIFNGNLDPRTCKEEYEGKKDTHIFYSASNPSERVGMIIEECIPRDGETSVSRAEKSFDELSLDRSKLSNLDKYQRDISENPNGINQTYEHEYMGNIPIRVPSNPIFLDSKGIDGLEGKVSAQTNSDVDEVIVLSGGKDSEGLVVEGQRNYMILPVFGERGARVTLQDDGNYLVEPIKTIAGVNMNGEMEYSFYSGAQTWNKKQLDFSLGYRFFHAENKTIANSTSMGEKEFNHMENLNIALCNDKIKHGCFTENEAAQIGGIVASIEITNDAINNGLYNPEEHFERGTMTEYAKTNWGYVMPAKYYESMSDKDGVYSTENQKILAKRLEDMCFDQGAVTFNDAYNCGYDIVSKGVTYGGDK